jgi:stage III sporulation protein AF
MMAALSLWLKKVVFVILMAVFLDLLLPTTTMQRYVRLVMGLFVVVTMLSPLMEFIHYRFDPQAISLDRLSNGREVAGLENIFQQGERLQRLQQQEAVASWKDQIANVVKTELETEYNVSVRDVQVSLSVPKTGDTPPVIVHLLVEVSASSRPGPAGTITVPPVPPIHVGLQENGRDTGTGTTTDPVESPAIQQEKRKMVTELSQQLLVAPSAIEIRFVAEGGGENP